jgi:hypothetical protein
MPAVNGVGEPCAGEPCAVSLGAGSPLQGVEVRKEVTSGPPALPERETGRGQEHGGKARSIEKVPKVLPCKARVIWRRPDCLKPSHQWWNEHTLRHGILCRSHRHQTILMFCRPNPSGRWTAGSELA